MEGRARIFSHREHLIKEEKQLLAEKELLLSKQEALLISEKEKLSGSDSLDIKRSILLPALQGKWEAEKSKLDAERIVILQTTPKVWGSLESKRIELEKIISGIKGKPSNSGNHALLLDNEGRLKQLLEIITLIDSAKGELHVV